MEAARRLLEALARNRLVSTRLDLEASPEGVGVYYAATQAEAQACGTWLAGQLAEASHGFLLTGTGIPASRPGNEITTPLFLETSRPGIFAVGDVRSGSVKRAAAAIGEGSMAVRLVFDRLQSTGSTDPIELGTSSPSALTLLSATIASSRLHDPSAHIPDPGCASRS